MSDHELSEKLAATQRGVAELQAWIDGLPRCVTCGYVVTEASKLARPEFHAPDCPDGTVGQT